MCRVNASTFGDAWTDISCLSSSRLFVLEISGKVTIALVLHIAAALAAGPYSDGPKLEELSRGERLFKPACGHPRLPQPPSVLVIVAVVWVVPRGGPIAVKTRSYGALALPEACLEICLEAWSLCFFACGVRWVKFPCFVILDFGSVLSVGSHGWRQSVDTKVGRSLIRSELASDEELEEPMEDQPLPADASSTAPSSGYIADFDSKEDEEDPEEDPADYPADGRDNYDSESSDDDDDDDDVEKDEVDKEEEEHLAPVDPSAVPTNDPVPSI
ncbi:hypothetical protein Tco_0502885 [Tanacetum coccineum]